MPKRRANVDSDDEAPSGTAAHTYKRARTADTEDETAPRLVSKAKGRGLRGDESESHSDSRISENDSTVDPEEEDRKLEEKYGEIILASLESRRNKVFGVRSLKHLSHGLNTCSLF